MYTCFLLSISAICDWFQLIICVLEIFLLAHAPTNTFFSNTLQLVIHKWFPMHHLQKKPAPENAMLHLIFSCPNCKTRNLLTYSLKLLWNVENYVSWEKQTNCLKLLLLTGANSTSKTNPLQTINNTPSTLLVLKQSILEIEQPSLKMNASLCYY